MAGVRSALEPWALDADDRQLCLFYQRSLRHKLSITVAGKTHIALKHDRFIAISDRHLADAANVEVGRNVSARGFYMHRVLTPVGWKRVFEHAKTGAYSVGGRGRRFALELTLNPTPPIISVMRAKIPAQVELLERPLVPAARNTPKRRPLTVNDVQALPALPGRLRNPSSRSEREQQSAQLSFLRSPGD